MENITLLLESQVKRVLYACLLTCPWFAYTQSEVSAQAKNNLLFVVYVAQDEQFFSLATPHEKELCETIDSVSILYQKHILIVKNEGYTILLFLISITKYGCNYALLSCQEYN